jgi:hypothetical protein
VSNNEIGSERRVAARARWLPSVVRLALLLCFLLPFVTLGSSCEEFRTKPITGVQLVVGTTPVIVHGSGYSNSSHLTQDDRAQISSDQSMARAGAIGLLVFTAAALAVAFRWRSRRAAVAAIDLGLLNLVALAMMLGAALQDGDAHIGVGLAYLFTLLAIIGDVYVFKRLGGRLALAVPVLILALPASQIIGLLIGARSGG